MDLNKVVSDLKALTREAEELMAATSGDVSDKAREARSRLNAALHSARGTAERIQERAVAGAEATDRMIRRHPYESLGIAFGIGLLIGVLAMRRDGR